MISLSVPYLFRSLLWRNFRCWFLMYRLFQLHWFLLVFLCFGFFLIWFVLLVLSRILLGNDFSLHICCNVSVQTSFHFRVSDFAVRRKNMILFGSVSFAAFSDFFTATPCFISLFGEIVYRVFCHAHLFWFGRPISKFLVIAFWPNVLSHSLVSVFDAISLEHINSTGVTSLMCYLFLFSTISSKVLLGSSFAQKERHVKSR